MSARTRVRVDFPFDSENRGQGRNISAEVFERARQRGRAKGLTYAGEVTPQEACALFDAGAAALVDVRSRPEHELVGRVPGTPLVEWRRYGEPHPNERFFEELSRHVDTALPVLFLCRSGVRSHHAAEAAARAGFEHAFNVLEGFEGELDDSSRRGRSGWRAAGLPWEQD